MEYSIKYLNQLTTEDIKEIIKLCVEGEKTYKTHYEPHGDVYGPYSMLVVMEGRCEFYMYDFELMHGTNNFNLNKTEYIKYMCGKFGEDYINDYASNSYDRQIDELEKELQNISTQKHDKISELKKYLKN